MSKMVGQERGKFVTDLFRSLAKKTKTDLGAEPEVAVEFFLTRIENVYKMRSIDVAQLTVDPAPTLDKLERIDVAIDNLVKIADNLPYQVRSHMRWGMWSTLDDEEFEKFGMAKPPIDQAMYIRSELLDIQKRLSAVVKKGESAASHYRLKKWTNKDLIALLWAIDSALIFARTELENPLVFTPPKSIKDSDHWADFIRGLAYVFDVNCTNLERNWTYMRDVQQALKDTNNEWVMKYAVQGETK